MNQDFRKLADAVADDIAAGRLPPGARLPTQRSFAYERGIAVSTASRVYAELVRRGLVVGEVGRGTFVVENKPAVFEPERIDGRIELERNFPILAGQSEAIARSLEGLFQPDTLDRAFRPVSARQLAALRAISAEFFQKGAWKPEPESFAFTSSGRQSIAAAISALVPVGGRLGVEAVTYPMVKSIAARLGVTLVPLALDSEGIQPEAIVKAWKNGTLAAVYLQPYLQNPLCISVTSARRCALLDLAAELSFMIIEDHVYGFLTDEAPLAAWAPERCIVVDSLSKRVAPGLALGFLSIPTALQGHFATTLRGGTWTASGFSIEAGRRLMADGTVAALTLGKQQDAMIRHQVAMDCLRGFEILTDPRSYHLWLMLPEGGRSEMLVAAAARAGITLTPSSAFAVTPGYAPNAIRIALSSPPLDSLRQALTRLAALLSSRPDDAEGTE